MWKRLAWGVAALSVMTYAITGGEYGTTDVFSQRKRMAALNQRIAELTHEVDSMRAELRAVTTDTIRLERMAREEWGMVRGEKELLYRMRTDTTRRR